MWSVGRAWADPEDPEPDGCCAASAASSSPGSSTTGGSALTAVRAVREAGATVVGVATVVDRGTGAREAIEAEGAPYRSLLGLADLGLA